MTPDEEAAVLADVVVELEAFASVLHTHGTYFRTASREIRNLHGVELSTYVLGLATKVGAVTEELHELRRYLTGLVRKKTLPL